MKRLALLLAAACLLSATSAQRLDRTFWLTDSFPRLAGAGAIFINPVTGRLYVPPGYESRGGLHIYDPATRQKRFLDVMEPGVVQGMAVSRELDRLYLLDALDDEVLTLDLEADSLLATRFEVESPLLVACNPVRRKLYLASGDALLWVFDATTGAHIRNSSLSITPTSLVWDSLRDRLYCSSSGHEMRVTDCASDTTVARVPGTRFTYAMVRHPSREQLVCWTSQYVKFVDVDSLAVVDSVACSLSPGSDDRPIALLSPGTNRLYLTGAHDLSHSGPRLWSNEVAIVDLSLGTLPPVRVISLGDSFVVRDAAVDETDGKLYVRDYQSSALVVIGAGDSVIRRIALDPTDWVTFGMAWARATNRLYVAERDGLVVIDCATDSVVERVSYFHYEGNWLDWQPTVRRLYFGGHRGIGWVGSSDSVEHWLPVADLSFVESDGGAGRLYLHGNGGLHVYDCGADTLLFSRVCAGTPSSALLLPDFGKLYLLMNDSTARVFDTRGDSFLPSIAAPRGKLDYNPLTRRLYAGRVRVCEIDPATDSVRQMVNRSGVVDFEVNPVNNELWMLHNDGITVVACDTFRTVHTMGLQGWNVRAVMDAGHNKLYCLRIEDALQTVIDCANYRESGTIDVGSSTSWHGPFLDSLHERLYIGSWGRQVVFDTQSDSTVANITAPGCILAANPADNVLYALDANLDQVSVIRDNPPGVAETMSDKQGMMNAAATVVRGFLHLTPEISNLTSDIILLDVSGRKVLDLKSGDNDVSRLSPGVYFVVRKGSRGRGFKGSSEKVVVTR